MAEIIFSNSHNSNEPECGGSVSIGKKRVSPASQHIIKMKK